MTLRFDLLDEATSVYLPKSTNRGLVPSRRRPGQFGGLPFGVAVVVLLVAVVGL